MNIFEALNAIAFNKQPLKGDDLEGNIPPFMLQRWLTMTDPFVALLLNDATNLYHTTLDTPDDWLVAFHLFVPKLKRRKIDYIKRPVKDAPEILGDCDNPKHIESIAMMLDISQREAHLMLQMSPELLQMASDDTQSFRKTAA